MTLAVLLCLMRVMLVCYYYCLLPVPTEEGWGVPDSFSQRHDNHIRALCEGGRYDTGVICNNTINT